MDGLSGNQESMVHENNRNEMQNKYLTFWIENQLFGLEISNVVQIVQMQEIIQIPKFPYYVRGIINLRGTIIPVVDVRQCLDKVQAQDSDRFCIIISKINDHNIGFLVDTVHEVTDLQDEDILPPSSYSGQEFGNDLLTGIGKKNNKIILLLDVKKLISEKDHKQLTDL